MDRICVLIVDDNDAVRDGLSALIRRQADMQVVAMACDGQEAIVLFRQHRPDVTIMDIQMPVVNGIDATKTICGEFPAAYVVALTVYATPEECRCIRQAGAAAILSKEALPEQIFTAIRQVINVA